MTYDVSEPAFVEVCRFERTLAIRIHIITYNLYMIKYILTAPYESCLVRP